MKYTMAHIGINCQNGEQAAEAAKLFQMMFGWNTKDGPTSVYADTTAEFLKTPGKGANGHIGIAVDNMQEAIDDLASRGFTVDMNLAKYTPEGKLRLVYLDQEVCGFAIHLVLKA